MADFRNPNDHPGRPPDDDWQQKPAMPLPAWFLGPKAENSELWVELLTYIYQDYFHWRRNYFPLDPTAISRYQMRSWQHETWVDNLTTTLDYSLSHLKAHFPFHHPRYIAHMLSDQSLPSVLGYFAGMLYNPNNVTDEAAPVTVELEIEVGKMLAEMLGYDPERSWTHIASGGTVANIEALWVARMVQHVPLIVAAFCRDRELDFAIRTADGTEAPARVLDAATLLALPPDLAVSLLKQLARYLVDSRGESVAEALHQINQLLGESPFNPSQWGLARISQETGKLPVIFVSEAAHYSIAKAANILGYGREAVRRVPVDSNFRLDIDALREQLLALPESEYVAAVIAIVGTTEEGAIDPVHKLIALREELARETNRSFWIHADAAWGGYFLSLFRGHGLPRPASLDDLDALTGRYINRINARQTARVPLEAPGKPEREDFQINLAWDDPEVYQALLAVGWTDSITVDPHKMGYIPYPAGAISFKNPLVTELVVQRAQYIAEPRENLVSIQDSLDIQAVGPYILEGSKPGAAATACWLAHTTIPLTQDGHGQIIRSVALSAVKLGRYLELHREIFDELEQQFVARSPIPFTFFPLNEPDTNILCYIARPMAWHNGGMVPGEADLAVINRLNRLIYAKLSIDASEEQLPMPYSQRYFVSRTEFTDDIYSAESIRPVLERAAINREDYRKHGLFVLRSTVMNPLYEEAANQSPGKDYLFDLLLFLHQVACASLMEMQSSHS